MCGASGKQYAGFLLTRPLRDVTYFLGVGMARNGFLLTRPLRDVTWLHRKTLTDFKISTHTPLAGRDYSVSVSYVYVTSFLLTRPLRDVTTTFLRTGRPITFLLTRPLRDVTGGESVEKQERKFLLTRPLRDVTEGDKTSEDYGIISTHTPLAGRDLVLS